MSIERVAATVARSLEGRVERDFPLARLTTYKLGGPAALFVEPSGSRDLELLGRALSGGDVPVLALGRGSNVVVSDAGFSGVAVRLGESFSWVAPADGGGSQGVRAGASTPLPVLANWAARRGIAGLEFMVAIPGSVGGAVRMNAGAHGRAVSDSLASASLFDFDRAVVEERDAVGLGLRYRASDVTSRHLVVEASFVLVPDAADTIRDRMESYRKHRAETQPGAAQNAGSVFKNPPGDSAGRLIEAAGLKGFRVGGASVSSLHANFFMAGPGATSQDVYGLVHSVRTRVAEQFGVELEPEIHFVGSFAPARDGVEGLSR